MSDSPRTKKHLRAKAMLELVRWLLCACIVFLGIQSQAQEIDSMLKELDISGSLLDMAPFDIITLIPSEGGRSVQVNLLELPNRKVPTNPKTTEKLRCVLNI